jgi:hypothetical protein
MLFQGSEWLEEGKRWFPSGIHDGNRTCVNPNDKTQIVRQGLELNVGDRPQSGFASVMGH